MENLKKNISDLYDSERELAIKAKQLILDIVDCIQDTQLEGVTPIPGNVKCATVSFSTIFSNPKAPLSAEYYISDYQTQILREKISSFSTLSEVVKFIDSAVNDGYTVVKGEKVLFNTAVKDKLVAIKQMF